MTKTKNQKRLRTRLFTLFCSLFAFAVLLAIPTLAANDDIPITLPSGEVIHGELIDSVTYIPLRRFADAMGGAEVGWSAKTRTASVSVTSLGLHMSVPQDKNYIVANGRYFHAPSGIRNVGGSIYVPIRPLAKAYSLEVTWQNATRSVALESTGKRLRSGEEFYDSDEVYWLSRIIHAEAGAEPFDGKIAVGNVILNRVRSPQYPNTIYGVIFDRKYGTQFSPVSFGTIYNRPNADSMIAAKLCLEGYTFSDTVLFFMNPRLATTNWIAENRPFAFTIGRHDFYD